MGIYGSIKREEKMKFQPLKSKKIFSVKSWYFIFADTYQTLMPNKHLAEKGAFVKDWAPAAIKISVTPKLLLNGPHT